MSKFKQNTRGYFQTGVSGYIGAGNKVSAFTRRSTPAFAKLKQIYGEQMKLLSKGKVKTASESPLSQEMKLKIRNSVKAEYKKYIKNQVISMAISVIILLSIIVITWRLIVYFYPNLQ